MGEDARINGKNIDWFLQKIVSLVDNTGFEFPISLQIDGFIVSGIMTSGYVYFQDLGEAAASAFSDRPDVATTLRDYFSEPAASYPLPDKDEDNALREPPAYIHLRDARFFHTGGTPIPTNTGVAWRGKLTDVAGFFLGTMRES